MRQLLRWSVALLLVAGPAAAQGRPLTARDSAVHALQRVAYGPVPGQVAAILQEGVLAWVDRQLAYQTPGDSLVARRERAFDLLDRSPGDLMGMYNRVQRERIQAQREAGPGGPPSTGQPPRQAPSQMAQEFRQLGGQLQQLVVVRGVVAENQLGEILTDFWTNHFNVFYGKALDRALLPGYVEQTIRPRALGKFRELLVATATSPAMLVYLDNAQSVAPGSSPPELARLEQARGRRMRPGMAARLDSARQRLMERLPTGINENYARELLELHTLGVDSRYTQQDVMEVARVLTGWGLEPPAQGAAFAFHEWAHDRGAKAVLGETYPAGGGMDEGIRLLEMLANHPATMHHVSARLCARFVSDMPTDGCIDDAVRAWKRSDGDIRQVVRAILHSPDFWAPAAVGSKVKTPLEFVVSAVRAVGGTPDDTPRLAQVVGRLGQPLYLQSVPTGYPETQEGWVNSGALLNRMNTAVALAGGRLPGVEVDLDRVVPVTADHALLVDRVNAVILSGRMSDRTRETILRELSDIGDARQARVLAVGLALGGPEFQRQ